MQVGFWKAQAWQPAWGLAVAQRFQACVDSPAAQKCRKAVVDVTMHTNSNRHQLGTVPAHLSAHEEWRRQQQL